MKSLSYISGKGLSWLFQWVKLSERGVLVCSLLCDNILLFRYRAAKLENRKHLSFFHAPFLFLTLTLLSFSSCFSSFFLFRIAFGGSLSVSFSSSYCTPFLLPSFHSLLLLPFCLPSSCWYCLPWELSLTYTLHPAVLTGFMMCIICHDVCSSGWWHFLMSVDENDLEPLLSFPMTFVYIFNRDYSILPWYQWSAISDWLCI